MEPLKSTRVLVIANRTAAAPRLLEAVERRALDETAEAMMTVERRAMTGHGRRFKGPGIGEERPRGE